MIRRLIARLRRRADDREMKVWRDWQERDYEEWLRRMDP